MPLFGVDVSSYQGAPDYARVKAAGVAFVIAKATEGLGYIDPQYARNRQAIPAAGLVAGAYHFLRGTHPGADQAGTFVHAADPHAIHALDVECLADVRKYGRPLDVPGFVAEYRRLLPGHPLLIYTGRDFWADCAAGAAPGPTYGPLWAAGAVPNAYVPGTGTLPELWAKTGGHPTSGLPWGGWTGWACVQFTAAAQVLGITGEVDGDAFGGTLDQLRALATGQEDDMPTLDDIGKLLDAKLAGLPVGTARAVHNQGLYGYTRPDGQPLTFADVLDDLRHRPVAPSATDIAAAITAQLTALPAGTATLDDATVAKIAGAAVTELATRLR